MEERSGSWALSVLSAADDDRKNGFVVNGLTFCCVADCVRPYAEGGALAGMREVLLLPGVSREGRRTVWLQELRFKAHGQYALPGTTVCKNAYLILRGLGAKQLKGLVAEIRAADAAGAASIAPRPHGNAGVVRVSEKLKRAADFLCTLALQCGDHCPTSGRIHVFMFKCPLTLFGMFVEDCEIKGFSREAIVSQRSFYVLFQRGSAANELIRHLRFKRSVVHKICGLCGGLALERSELFAKRSPSGSAEWESWLGRQKNHMRVIYAERRAYQEIRADVRAGKVCDMTLLIQDAGRPLLWPRRLFDSDAARAIPLIKGAFIGIINHTAQRATIFLSAAPGVPVAHRERTATKKQKARSAGVSYTWESTDCNCTLLLLSLLHEHHSGRLRRKLHLQVDGGSDARGFVVIQLLGVLCALGVVDCVVIASLIPGHTHEDIDALFSVLTKSLKTKAGERRCRTWNEIMSMALEVYPGWDAKTERKPGPTGVAEIPFVWKLREAFSQGPEFDVQPTLSKKMHGLFGKGTEHDKKPSRFCIQLGPAGRPVVTAYLSSAPGAPIFDRFNEVEIFQFCPRLFGLPTHNLAEGWEAKHAKLVAALQAGNSYKAGYTTSQVDEMAAMKCVFADPPPNAVFFGVDRSACPGWQKLEELGLAPPKGRRQAGAAGRGAGRGLEPVQKKHSAKKKSARADQDDDDDGGAVDDAGDGGLVYNSDESDHVEEEVLELSSSSDELGANESVVDSDEPVFKIEAWLDRRFNDVMQGNEYLLKFEGYEEPEWTLGRRINGPVPSRTEEQFDRRDTALAEEERRERKTQAYRAAARLAAGGVDDVNDDDVEQASASVGGGNAASAAPAPAAAAVGRQHLRRNATKKKN